MKDTIRTASVLEIYNSSIGELKSELTRAKMELAKVKAAKAGKRGIYVLLNFVFGFLALLALMAVIVIFTNISKSDHGYDRQREMIFGQAILLLITAPSAFFGFKKAASYKINNLEKYDNTIDSINAKILDIEKAITEKNIRKKTLLEVEEVVVSKDMKDIKDDIQVVSYVKPSSDEKVCPMCAETIKAAARVCRFCGHRFD